MGCYDWMGNGNPESRVTEPQYLPRGDQTVWEVLSFEWLFGTRIGLKEEKVKGRWIRHLKIDSKVRRIFGVYNFSSPSYYDREWRGALAWDTVQTFC